MWRLPRRTFRHEKRLELLALVEPGPAHRRRALRRDVHPLRLAAPGGLQPQCHQHRGQQRRPPCLRRHRPDDSGPPLRPRSVCRHGVRDGELPRVAPGRRHAGPSRAGRAGRAGERAPLRRAQRPHRRLRTPAADHRDAGDRRDLLRRRALAASRPGRRRQRGPRRLHDRFTRQRGSVRDRPPRRSGPVHLDSLPAVGAGPGGLCHPPHRRSPLRLRSGPALATTLPRHRPPHLGQPRLVPAAQGQEAGGSVSMTSVIDRIDKALLAALCCIVVLLLGGALYSRNFLSLDYLLQQLQVAAFLGVIATGAMLVILLGHIDLSIPWVVTTGGMMSTAAAGHGGMAGALAIPFAVACGLGIGLINGIGVAYLRVPSMIFTLAINAIAQGLMVVHTSGFAPQEHATPAMHFIAVERSILGIPNAVWMWAAIGGWTVVLLRRTTFGRRVYGIGNSERAVFLSRGNVDRVVVACFAIAGTCSAFAGVLLAGYSTKAYQAMGDPYLLPAIAAVVLGGTSILGGRGTYLGTVAGVVLMTLLQSILSIVQVPEAARQVIYGVVIILMLLVYGRGQKVVS